MLQGEKRGKRLMAGAAEKPIIKAHHLGDDNIEYYTCPITSMMSMMKNEVLQYRRFEKRVINGRLTCGDVKTLQGNYNWIPEGWAMEIRAGGEGVKKKIFKFLVHKSSGVRLTNKDDVKIFEEIVRVPKMPPPSKEDGSKQDVSKRDVLLFEEPIKKRKTPRACEDPVAIECDTSSQDNMIAQLDFYTERLSAGWVKETYFRPENKEKTDTYFTDPSSSECLVFRTKKAATKYFWTGERPKDSWKPTESVTKKYKDLLVVDEKDLDGQHEPKQKKPKTTSTEADEAMTCSQARLLGINRGQEKN